MDIDIFLKGAGTGFVLCAPLGPIGIICIRRTLLDGRLIGLLSLLGASTVDALYCAIAGFGITFLSTLLVQKQAMIQSLCCIILIVLGIRISLAPSRANSPAQPAKGGLKAFTSTLLITMSNPMPILIFTAVFTALGINGWNVDFSSTATLVMGVFVGSAAWSPLLIAGTGLIPIGSNFPNIRRIDKLSGFLICVIGLTLGMRALVHHLF